MVEYVQFILLKKEVPILMDDDGDGNPRPDMINTAK